MDIESKIKKESLIIYLLKLYTGTFSVIFKKTPIRMVLRILGKILDGTAPALYGLIFMKLINYSVAFIDGDNTAPYYIITSLILLILFSILKQLFKMILDVTYEEVMNYEFMTSSTNFFNKIKKMTSLAFQNNKFKTELDTSQHSASRYMILFYVEDFIQYICFFASAIILLAVLNIWLAIGMTVLIIIYSYMQYLSLEKDYDRGQEIEQLQKQADHIKSLFKTKYSVKELKVFKSADFLIKKLEKILKDILKLELSSKFKRSWIRILYNLLLETLKIIVLMLLIYNVYMGIGNVGNFAVYTTISTSFATMTLIGIKIYLIIQSLISYQKHDSFFENEKWIEPESSDMTPIDEIDEIIFENVYFRYNDDSDYILNNINLKIKKGDYVALVGLNGAGKTTLVKLIVGIYQPTKGTIYYNKVPHTKITMDNIRNCCSMIYQDFCKYGISLEQNICFNKKVDNKTFDNYLRHFEIDKITDSLPNGLNTLLRTDVNYEQATDLSGGQWQKIAIMRALVKESSVLIMDEPSSSLDIETEAILYNTVSEVSKSNIKFIISHQLACVKEVNKIIVLENGRITDNGSHDELMKRNTVYKTLFLNQADKYTI